MNKYIELFMRYLVLECACVTSRTGKNGGIYEYVQCEFAYNSCRLKAVNYQRKMYAIYMNMELFTQMNKNKSLEPKI